MFFLDDNYNVIDSDCFFVKNIPFRNKINKLLKEIKIKYELCQEEL